MKEGDDEKNYYYNVTIKVDDQKEQIVKGKIIDGYLTAKWETVLSGEKKYRIIKSIDRRYNFEADHYFGFRAKYISNGMHIAIVHPEDMSIVCVERGTQNNFKKEIFNASCCEFRYNGLILPRQGYVIIMSK